MDTHRPLISNIKEYVEYDAQHVEYDEILILSVELITTSKYGIIDGYRAVQVVLGI